MGVKIVRTLVFVMQGCVSGVFSIIPFVWDSEKTSGDDHNAFVRKQVIDELRKDREKGVVPGPGENPSRDPSTVEFFFTATMEKQRIYRNLPHRVGDSYDIIDAFVCLGSRFELKPLQVFVEVCQSRLRNDELWANVYYVADSQIPACVIHVQEWIFMGPILEVEVAKEEVRAGA